MNSSKLKRTGIPEGNLTALALMTAGEARLIRSWCERHLQVNDLRIERKTGSFTKCNRSVRRRLGNAVVSLPNVIGERIVHPGNI